MRCRRCLGVMHVDESPDDANVVEPWRCETWRCLGCGDCIDFIPICTSRAKKTRTSPHESTRLVAPDDRLEVRTAVSHRVLAEIPRLGDTISARSPSE